MKVLLVGVLCVLCACASNDNVVAHFDARASESGYCGYPRWVLQDGTLTITGSGEMTEICDLSSDQIRKVKSIEIGNGITSVIHRAFKGWSYLESVTFPDSLTTIGESAFEDCSLRKVVFPNELKTISEKAFYDCIDLESVSFNSELTYIGKSSFSECGITAITIPPNVKNISEKAFFSCASLVDVSISEGVERIQGSAFAGCRNLGSVNFPNSLQEIGPFAFSNCESLGAAIIPDTVKILGTGAFSSCSSLTSLRVTNGIESLYGRVFFGCASLKNVTIPEGIEWILPGAFDSCSALESVSLPSTLKSVSNSSFSNCPNLTEFHFGSQNSFFTSIDGVLFNNDKKSIVLYPCRHSDAYSIPLSVTTLESNCFYDCDNLRKLVIPESVTKFETASIVSCEQLDSVIYLGVDDPCSSATDGFFQSDNIKSVYTRNIIRAETVCGKKVIREYNDFICDEVKNGRWFVKKGSTISDGMMIGDSELLADLLNNYHLVDKETKNIEYTEASVIEEDINFIKARLVKLNGTVQGEYFVKDSVSLCAGIPELCVKPNEFVVGKQETNEIIDMNTIVMNDMNLIVSKRSYGIVIEFEKAIKSDDIAEFITSACELIGVDSVDVIVEVDTNDKGEILVVVLYLKDSDTATVLVDSLNDIDKEKCAGVVCRTKRAYLIRESSSTELSIEHGILHYPIFSVFVPFLIVGATIF